jgi:uncharacterized membrane protein YheB (UPF0754 family)
MVNKIIEAMKQWGDGAGENIAGQILETLNSKTIGQLIAIAYVGGGITIDTMADLMNRFLNDMPRKDINVIDELLKKQAGEVLGDNFDVSIITAKILPDLFHKLKNEYLYTDRFKQTITTQVSATINHLGSKTVPELVENFSADSIAITLNQQTVTNALLDFWETLAAMPLGGGLSEAIATNIRVDWENLWNDNQDRELRQFYDALQHDAVYTKIADSIVELLNQNLAPLLAGNIKKLVNNELVKLDATQINTMVQNFMGKELKPITMLGAFLGAAVGGLSAWGFSFLPFAADFTPAMLAIQAALFALVGIGTNWIAIQMLFKPYKPIMGLPPVSPFVGVVAAKKPQFAKNIAAFVQNILNDETLRHYFIQHKDAIKKNCEEWVTSSNYAMLDTLFAEPERMEVITGVIFQTLQDYVTTHRAELSEKLCDMLKKSVADGKLVELTPAIRDALVKKLTESDVAGAIVPILEKELDGKTIAYVTNIIDAQTPNIIATLARELTPEKVKALLLEHNDAFVNYIEKTTLEKALSEKTFDELNQKVSAQVRKQLPKAITPIIDVLKQQELNPSTKLRDMFHGALPNMLREELPSLVHGIIKQVGAMRGVIAGEIENGMHGFAALTSQKDVRPIVDIIIDEELEPFLLQKQAQLLEILNTVLDNQLADIGFSNDSLHTDRIEGAITAALNSDHVQDSLSHLMRIVINDFAQLPVKTLLDLININDLRDVMNIADPLLKTAVEALQHRLNQPEVTNIVASLIKSIVLKYFDEPQLMELFTGVELERELRGIITAVLSDPEIMRAFSDDVIPHILRDIATSADFYDDAQLRSDLTAFIGNLEAEWPLLRATLTPHIKTLLQGFNRAITRETKDRICRDYLLTAILEACSDHFSALIRAINVQKIIEDAVNEMHPMQVEKMFYKFAGTYFRTLTFYGWIGVLGGIASYLLACLLSIVY